MVALLTPEQQKTEEAYQSVIAAASQGAEAVQKLMAKIAPGHSWVEAAWELIKKRREHVPHFIYEDPEFGGTVCFSPRERPLRKILLTGRS